MDAITSPYNRLTWKDLTEEPFLDAILSNREGQFVEFKTRMPRLSETAKVLAAFMNSGGGLLLLGVGDDGELIGIPPRTDVSRHVLAAAQLLSGDNSNFLVGTTRYRNKTIGIVRISDFGTDPDHPVTLDSRIIKRIGEVAAYLSPPEYRKSFSSALEPIGIELSDDDLRQFLRKADEDALTAKLIAPLLRHVGFESICVKGHRDRSLEFGQDIRGFKLRLPTGDWLYFASQVKTGEISSSAKEPNKNIESILTQIRMGFKWEVFDPQTNSYHNVNHVLVIASGDISSSAQEYVYRQLAQDKSPGRVIWIDGNRLLELAQGSAIPVGMQTDIKAYLRAVENK